MAQKALPIGIQDFAKLIQSDCIYVDKTEYYHRLITGGNYFFLSRPRRFGKSLLISTLKEIFDGNRALFEGLWIHDKIDWEPRPVIRLDFSEIVSRETPFHESLDAEMDRVAAEHGLPPLTGDYSSKFRRIIEAVGSKRKVAILVDEYDKPIISYIDDLDRAQENRAVMKNFYSVIKGNDAHIAFFMLTGVSKFSQVSIFSDLNNLNDITLDEAYAQMLGYTEAEILKYFPDYLSQLQAKWADIFPDVLPEIKKWYNGYSWDGQQLVYNPFSILNLFSKNDFLDYWFATGTPTFLTKLIRLRGYSVFDLKGQVVSLRSFNAFDIPQLEINSLLFQTGYLTIKKRDRMRQTVTLDFPNLEVANAFSFHLLTEFSEKGQEGTDALVLRMANQLLEGNVDAFIAALQSLFAGIAYPNQPTGNSGLENYEKYYHTMFYLVLKLLGYDVQAEVMTNTGRIDTVVTTEHYIYVMEFKLGDAASAMAQIRERGYHQQYLGSGKTIVLVGIGFDVATRNVGEVLVERV
ncbi:MAG: ATP-binding protein [Bacteroidia bacterium]